MTSPPRQAGTVTTAHRKLVASPRLTYPIDHTSARPDNWARASVTICDVSLDCSRQGAQFPPGALVENIPIKQFKYADPTPARWRDMENKAGMAEQPTLKVARTGIEAAIFDKVQPQFSRCLALDEIQKHEPVRERRVRLHRRGRTVSERIKR